MTVKIVNESQERVSGSVSVSVSVSELQKPNEPLSTKLTMEFGNLVGQTVTKVDRRMVVGTKESTSRKKARYVHSQILRISEEDSHLGEDFRPSQSKTALSLTDAELFPRPILPSSPLSGKAASQKASPPSH